MLDVGSQPTTFCNSATLCVSSCGDAPASNCALACLSLVEDIAVQHGSAASDEFLVRTCQELLRLGVISDEPNPPAGTVSARCQAIDAESRCQPAFTTTPSGCLLDPGTDLCGAWTRCVTAEVSQQQACTELLGLEPGDCS